MDGAHNNRRYKAGDTVKLELVLHHGANLREVRVVFEHTHDKSIAPLIARARPRPISERGSDGSIQSRLQAEIVIPGALTPGVYELTRISYETAGRQLGHVPVGDDLEGVARMTFEVVGEPSDTPGVVNIASRSGRNKKSPDRQRLRFCRASRPLLGYGDTSRDAADCLG